MQNNRDLKNIVIFTLLFVLLLEVLRWSLVIWKLDSLIEVSSTLFAFVVCLVLSFGLGGIAAFVVTIAKKNCNSSLGSLTLKYTSYITMTLVGILVMGLVTLVIIFSLYENEMREIIFHS